ncbi:hypothetical protein HN51_065248 [Arachis hypogaea]|nr:Pectinesterase inhibitor [Arachis hypogaea]
MASFMSRTALFLLLSAVALFAAEAIPASRNFHVVQHRLDLAAEISKFCQSTQNATLCTKILQPYEGIHFDQFKALDITLDSTSEQAKLTLAAIESLFFKKGLSKSTKDSLKICKDQYKSILGSIKEAKAMVATKNVIEAKYKVSAVISFYEACSDSFDIGETIPFAAQSEPVFQIGGNCLDILAAMEKALPATPVVMNSPPSPYSNVIGTIS